MNKDYFDFSPDVAAALNQGRPVVALESTIIAHGLPYPDNYRLALDLEAMLRDEDVVPATIAILHGRPTIGLTSEQLLFVAKQPDMPKASLRDTAVLMARGMNGATTVASTMQIAHWAGISVFVTGGIGGVHRHGETTLDISADLQALSRYPLAVVCAGAKSVLDLPKTLEVLETLGVPVLGYRSAQFPAFYLPESGLPVDYVLQGPDEAAAIIRQKQRLAEPGGILITVPIPADEALDENTFNALLEKIMKEVEAKDISGKQVTPYLLRRLHEESRGETVQANTALVKNNLKVGAAVARALARSPK